MAGIEHLEWRRSSYCDAGTCVEVAVTDEHVHVRHSEDPTVKLTFSLDEWRAFIRGVSDQLIGDV